MSDTTPAPTSVVVAPAAPGTLVPIDAIAPKPVAGITKDFALFQAGHQQVLDLVRENLGGGGIDFQTLTAVSWPNVNKNSAPAFMIDTAEGPRAVAELVCVILGYRDGRVMWGTDFAESDGSPPICVSEDMRNGRGNPGGECEKCPFSQFGSDTDSKGNTKRGKACQERKRMFLMVPWSLLPIHINVPPTSLKQVRGYFAKLIGLGLPYHSVVTKITLARETNADNVEYAVAQLAMVGRIGPAEHEVFKSMRVQFADAFKAQTIVPSIATPPKPSSTPSNADGKDPNRAPV